MPVTGSLRPIVVSEPFERWNSMPEGTCSSRSGPSAGAWTFGRGISREVILVPPICDLSSSSVSRRRRESLRIMRTAISGLPWRRWSKVEPLICSRRRSVRARAEAARGRSSSTDISPKKSPFSSTARICSSSPTWLRISTFPSLMMYISVPRSPSRKTYSPVLTSTAYPFLPPPEAGWPEGTGFGPVGPVVLNTVLAIDRYPLSITEQEPAAFPPGRQTHRERTVGGDVPAFKPPGERPGEARESVRDGYRPVARPVDRLSIRPLAFPEAAYNHTRDIREITREPQVGQHAVHAVWRLADVLPEDDPRVEVGGERRAESRHQQAEAPPQQRAA